ncbi:glycosyltransferase [Alienimonas californiensis]|uniref:Glycosyltransferase EpsE n=1 Tax=Alienimonas californiensis TaxID=2527989 RepID=A0A517PCU5_9PLAN|nr:glycosyltransferase [Alienimonas californiensis]QDT17199.1 Putative glycosyltransferase EpsE [Alienimonas californiensis]
MTSSAPPPAVTVLMNVWRADPRHLERAVASVLAQTFDNWELVIVEDPSDRPAAPTLARFADPRVRHVANEIRTSLMDQKNLGLKLARGTLVALLDADDVARPERLREQVAMFAADPELVAAGSQLAVIDDDDELIGYRRFPTADADVRAALAWSVPLHQPSVMVRRDFVRDLGGYGELPGGTSQDHDLWSRIAHSGGKFANHPEVLLYYRLHAEQMKARKVRKMIRDSLLVRARYWPDGGAKARFRRLTDRALLLLPPRLVTRLIRVCLYRDPPPPCDALGPVPPLAPRATPERRSAAASC